MNKTHRVVYSAARGAFVVAHEFAASAGKSSTRKSIIAQSIGAALVILAGPAMAQMSPNPVTGPVGAQSLTAQTPPETLVITNTGVITATSGAAGVTGSSVTAAGIVNSGTILGATSAGEATPTYDGVYLINSTLTGGITNTGTASYIQGNSHGINITGGGVATISNAGTIAGAVGIEVNAGTVDTIMNVGSASSISGQTFGISVDSAASVTSVVNQGTISGSTYTGFNVNGATVSTLNNLGSALITGGSNGIQVTGNGVITNLTNSGAISNDPGGQYTSGAAINVNNSGTIVSLVNLGTISSGNYAAVGVYGGTISSLNNSGLIMGPAKGIQIQGGSIGSLVNSGMITGGSTGIQNNGGTISSISNSGVITGGDLGISVENGSLGALVNSGTITGGSTGVSVYNSTVSSIHNSGLISGGGTGVYVAYGDVGSLVNSGIIQGGRFGIVVYGEGANTTFAGGIINSGLISGANVAGIAIYDDGTVAGGITNLPGGVISGASGVSIGEEAVVSSISNQAGATIVGTGGSGSNGVGVTYFSTVSGQVVNAGVITGSGNGIEVNIGSTIAGGIVNSGLISGTTYAGIALNLTGSVFGGISNLKLGTIAGGMTGIEVSNNSTLTGGITNSGLISGGVTGVLITNNSTFSGGIQNSGTITGAQNGIAISAGTISNNFDPFIVVPDEVNQTAGVTLFSGDIVNSGLISGTSVAGIAINAVSVDGAISNMAGGTITGGQTGISLTNASTVTGGLTNSGLIEGGKYAVYVDATSSLGPITIAGNTAQFVGDVYAPGSDVTVASGSRFSATNVFDVNSFTVSQGSTVNLSDPASTAGDASGITVANGFNNAGTVSVARGVTGVINGAYTQAGSGQYKLGASSVTSYGVLAVNGTVNLPTAAKIYVDVAADSTLTNKEVLKGVITSTGLTASTFDVTDNLDLVSFTGKIDGNNVDLVTKVNALVLADVLANGNYNAVPLARVLDEIIATDSNGPFASVIDDLARLQTSQQVSRTVSEFLPLLSGASNVSSIGTLWELDQVIQSRLDGNTGLSSGDDYLTDRGAWVKPFGTWGNQSDQGSAPGFTSNTGGLVLGADGAVSPQARVGLAFAYASSDITGKGAEGADENKVDMYQVVGYGSYALDPVTELNFQIDGGGNQNSGHRSIPSFGTNANSSYSSSTAHFGVGLGRSMPIDEQTVFTPSVRMDYTWVRSDSYNESGAGPLNLNVQSASVEQLLTSVDAKLVHKVTDYASVFGNLGVGYDSLARNNTQVISAFAGAPGLPFATEGVGLKPWTVLAGFGVVATPQGGPEITVRYDLQDRSSFTEQSFSVKARWAF